MLDFVSARPVNSTTVNDAPILVGIGLVQVMADRIVLQNMLVVVDLSMRKTRVEWICTLLVRLTQPVTGGVSPELIRLSEVDIDFVS